MKFHFIYPTILLVSVLASCSHQAVDENEQAIRDVCKNEQLILHSIAFLDTIDSNISRERIHDDIDSLSKAIESVGDSSLISILYPTSFKQKRELENLLSLDDYAYLRYKINVSNTNGYNINKYALVPFREDLMGPIKLVDEDYEFPIDFQTKESEMILKTVLEYLTLLQSKSAEELEDMKNKALLQIEEARNAPSSWSDVAKWMQKRGCTVVGIFQGTQAYSGTLTIYSKGGTYYIASCSISCNPVDFEYADILRKLNSYTYQHNEPGSDMPEKYVINGSLLISYCYNPDMNEWVNMGSYHKQY